MIKINKDIVNYIGNIDKVTYYSKYTIVVSDNKKYLLKNKNYKLENIEKYLSSIEYNYFVPIINSYNDDIYIYPYYDELDIDVIEKYESIINALSILHIKSADCVTYSKSDMKIIYENILNKIDGVMNYYNDLQDFIEELSFPKPALYLLINNISTIYKLLDCAKDNLYNWYKEEEFKTITSLLINDLNIDNFVFGEKNYFINFDDLYRDIFLYDLVNFYRSNFRFESIWIIIDKYMKRLGIRDYEKYLFFSLISIPETIEFKNNNIVDLINIRNIIDYSNMTLEYILKKYKENKKTDKDEFE